MKTVTFPKLTKRDAQGVPRFYWATVEGPVYRTHSQKTSTGRVISSSPTVPRRQSIRSAHEQAKFEVEALYRKRDRLGWEQVGKKRVERGKDPHKYYMPMLAHKYPHLRPKLPCFAQPKLDGIRCLVTRHGLWTRKNVEITSVPHLRRQAIAYLERHGDNMAALDGEIYVHGLDLHTISGLARRKRPSAESMQLQLHIFDCEEKWRSPFETRHQRLKKPREDEPDIRLVQTEWCESQEDMDYLHQRWVRQGYEGSMYRDRDAFYESKRTKFLLKRKDFQEKEFLIIGIREGNGAWRGCAKAIDYVDERGETFESNVRGTQAYLRTVLRDAHKIIGSMGTVRYFNLTPDRKVPYLPVTVNLDRWDLNPPLSMSQRYARLVPVLGKKTTERLLVAH